MPLRLELDRVTAGYGKVEILHDLSISVPAGAVVALLGPNGAGKTTTLRAISGTLPVWRGRVRLDGERVNGTSTYAIARAGVTLMPEGRGVFPSLSVRENLAIAARATPGDSDQRAGRIDFALTQFPRLKERFQQQAGTLSGGEQQMLALSRALMAEPKVLLLDEISMGLAPRIVEQLFGIVAGLRADGLTIVLVEQYLTYALQLADVCYLMAKGRVAFVGEPAELADSEVLTSSYLGVG
ncbi:MAG: transporter ATP-binding protein [Acidimicrobiales bacterium]|nr:transporter ATP-binding protein [Acidimicrobiales bacterium]